LFNDNYERQQEIENSIIMIAKQLQKEKETIEEIKKANQTLTNKLKKKEEENETLKKDLQKNDQHECSNCIKMKEELISLSNFSKSTIENQRNETLLLHQKFEKLTLLSKKILEENQSLKLKLSKKENKNK
jgi:nitrate/TMAO reductase-like tetraheme cytochrome c subunit